MSNKEVWTTVRDTKKLKAEERKERKAKEAVEGIPGAAGLMNHNSTFIVGSPRQPQFNNPELERFMKDKEVKKPVYVYPSAPKDKVNGTKEVNGKNSAQKNKPSRASQDFKPILKLVDNGNTFEGDVSSVSLNKLSPLLEKTKVHYPDQKSVWLKDCAVILNTILPYEVPDSVFVGKTMDYPSCLLSKEVTRFVKNLFDECTGPTLSLFLNHCYEMVARNLNNGTLPTMGYRIMAQLLSRAMPNLLYDNLISLNQLRISNKNRHKVALSILWLSAQSIPQDLATGLKVWFEIFFPMVELKAYTEYSINCLESYLVSHKKVLEKTARPIMTVRQFFSIVDLMFIQKGLNPKQVDTLNSLYDSHMMRRNVLQSTNEDLDQYFSESLKRCNENVSSDFLREMTSFSSQCVKLQPQLLTQWVSEFKTYPVESSYLLQDLVDKDSVRSFPRQLFEPVVEAAKSAQTEIKSKGGVAKNKMKLRDMDFTTFEKKMKSSRFNFGVLIRLVIICLTLGVAFDVRTNGSWKKSFTYRNLKEQGVITQYDKASVVVVKQYRLVSTWAYKNVPIYYKQLDATVGPYVRMVWANAAIVWGHVWEAALPVRQWADTTFTPLMAEFNKTYWPLIVSKVNLASTVVYNFVVQIISWIQTNLVFENLSYDKVMAATKHVVTQSQAFVATQWGAVQKQLKQYGY